MIDQLLDLTRARLGGGLTLESKPCDMGTICRNVVEELEAPIDLDIDGDMMGTWDEDRVAQVLSNLTGNAVQYATPGTPVALRARAEGSDVIVTVTNQGDPIPAELLPHLFEPFRRAKEHANPKTGNLGLGLYIAHVIVLAHGGTLDVRSAAGETTFTVRLPRIARHL
jgi:signal transduction histidine kinase